MNTIDRDYLHEIKLIIAELRKEDPNTLSPDTRVAHDLSIDGDDWDDFLKRYTQHFGVDMSAFEFARHFSSEAVIPEAFWRIRKGFSLTGVPLTLGQLAEAARAGRWTYDHDAAI